MSIHLHDAGSQKAHSAGNLEENVEMVMWQLKRGDIFVQVNEIR